MSHTANRGSWELLLLYPGRCFEAFPAANPGDGARAVKQLPQEHCHWSCQPCLAHPCSHGPPAPCKSHASTMWNSLRMLPHRSMQEFTVLLWCLPATWRKAAVGSYMAWSYIHQQDQAQRRLWARTNAEISWDISPALCLWAAVRRRDLMVWKKYLLPIVTGLESLDHHQNRKQQT